MEYHFPRHFCLQPKTKNAFWSTSSIHHKKVHMVLVWRCKVLVLVLNTRLGLGLEIKVLVLILKKVFITSLQTKTQASYAGRHAYASPCSTPCQVVPIYGSNETASVTSHRARYRYYRYCPLNPDRDVTSTDHRDPGCFYRTT